MANLTLEPVAILEYDSDGENRRERNEFTIEQAILDFNDEPPIMHNVYPDTESEDGEEVQRTSRRRNDNHRDNIHIDEIRRGDGILYKGQLFINGVAFKEAVLDYALQSARNLRQYKYDKKKIGYICLGGDKDNRCSWRIYCSILGKSSKWQVKNFENKHSCVINGRCKLIRVPVIARLFMDKIREEPEYFKPMKIEGLIMEKWKICVSRLQCQAARRKALKWIDREYEEQFSRLRWYENEIRESNPNSSVEVDCVTNEEGLDVFRRFYVCFDNLRKSWKESCRRIIGLDGCFLRSKMKGQLLVALGRDADNAIYPIAWAVVDVENITNWLWFVQKIKVDLELGDGDGYIMISDRQKGLIKAVKLELPQIEHRMCVRHIYGNLKAKHGKKPDMKWLIWKLAWSYNSAEYKENLDRLFNYNSVVYADVMKSNPESWCWAFHKIGNHCEDVENNSTESWNNTVVKAREKPFVPMLETIARLAMVRIAKRDVKASVWNGLCTPYAMKYLEAELEKASMCIINRSTNNMYDVNLSGCSYRLSLENRTCTCRRWNITGIPCEHGYAVILHKKLQAEDYVANCFRTTMWRKTYTNGVVPLRGSRFWPESSEPKVHLNPDNVNDKKDNKRKRGINESPTKKQPKVLKRIMHCSICEQPGHNSRFHKKDKQPSIGESSQTIQMAASQGTQMAASQNTFTQS